MQPFCLIGKYTSLQQCLNQGSKQMQRITDPFVSTGFYPTPIAKFEKHSEASHCLTKCMHMLVFCWKTCLLQWQNICTYRSLMMLYAFHMLPLCVAGSDRIPIIHPYTKIRPLQTCHKQNCCKIITDFIWNCYMYALYVCVACQLQSCHKCVT